MEIKLPTLDELRSMGTPEYFGLGFIQLKVDQTYRFHFYHDSLIPIVPDEEVHDHRYDFESHILNGIFTQSFYSFEPNIHGDVELVEVDCQTPGVKLAGSVPGYLRLLNVNTYATGSSYWIDADVFHTVESEKNVVTLLKRGPVKKPFARVVKPRNSETVCPFSAPIGADACWDLIENILQKRNIENV